MTSSWLRFATAAALVALALLPDLQRSASYGCLAGSFPCNCYNGAPVQTSPRCVCGCNENYLPPQCTYRSTSNVSIEVWFDYPSTEFVRERSIETFTANLAPSVPIQFVLARRGNFAKTAAVYKLLGLDAYNLKAAVASGATWVTQARILAAYDEYTHVEKPSDQEAQPVILYDGGTFVLTLEGLLYLIGVLVAVVVMFLCEFCCCGGANDEDTIRRDIMMGVWDPRLGYEPNMPYKHEVAPAEESPQHYR